MSGNDLVARNARRFRLERGLSIGEVARRSALSKQTVSKVEAGVGNPTVDTLIALGVALDIPARRLLTEWGTPVFVQRADEGEWDDRGGWTERLLDEIYGSGYVRTLILRLERGEVPDEVDAHPPGTLHHVYVISGKVRLGPVGETVDIAAGDFVRYPGDTAHRHQCLSDRAVIHMVTTLPQVRQFGPRLIGQG
jgi:transcriptional regulator with XRE-family HTH domain